MKQGYFPENTQPVAQQAQPAQNYRTQPSQKVNRTNSRNIVLLTSSIIGVAYAVFLAIYFMGVNNQSFLGVIAAQLVTPHIVLVSLAAVANGLSWYLDNGWVALAAAVLYLVAGLVFTMYLLYVLLPMILAFVGFVMVNNKNQRNNQPVQHPSSNNYNNQSYTRLKREYNKRLIMIVSAAVVVLALSVGAVFALGGNSAPAKQTASSIVQKFVSAGLPVESVISYTAETDGNNLLGRPNSYTSKTSFADSRIDQFGSDPQGGTVEVFNNKADATSRKEYVSAFSGSIFGMYAFQSNNVLLRISQSLTPSQAEEYNAVLLSK